ncbi:AAA family ATPase [Streptomyces sp. Y1]|uniref:AAA family ATPase n=1 Tax=Streptomyces sp. Y1 TaxID=3238634 RepID=A0AB39TM59_9ACTN
MPYLPLPLILKAAERLQAEAHPLIVVTLSAMLRTAAKDSADAEGAAKKLLDGLPWGGSEEKAFLDAHFRLPGAPDTDAPYRAIWKSESPWVKERYAETSIQRIRKGCYERGKVLRQQKKNPLANRPRDEWALTVTAGQDMLDQGYEPTPLIDLAIWFGRNVEVADLDELAAWFRAEFRPDVLDLPGTILPDNGIPTAYWDYPLTDQPVTDAELTAALGGTEQAGQLPGPIDGIIAELDARIAKSGFAAPTGLVRRVLTAWLRGDMVVLIGQPGTGKTTFASNLAEAMSKYLKLPAPVLIPIRSDFDEAEFIGYQQLDGTPQLREFATEILDTERPLDARVVILEEFNLATIESYLASVLIATQEPKRRIRLPDGTHRALPVDAFILATCNSYLDEPETRTRISAPAKRRATVITMPNVLADRFEAVDESDREAEIVSLAVDQIRTEHRRVQQRVDSGLASMFDGARLAQLATVETSDSLSPQTRSALTTICAAILGSPEGRSWFTMGLLRDLALAIAYEDRGDEESELRALVDAVADKLVPQLRGPHARADELAAAVAGLTGAEHVGRLLDRMKDGAPEELLPLL